jgi:hypothetical protein
VSAPGTATVGCRSTDVVYDKHVRQTLISLKAMRRLRIR